MDKKLLKEEYKRLLTKAIEGRPGGMALMIVLEETDFYNSPASAKHHLNVPGGLVLHSLNVARTALELCENMPQFARCDKNAVLTAALHRRSGAAFIWRMALFLGIERCKQGRTLYAPS